MQKLLTALVAVLLFTQCNTSQESTNTPINRQEVVQRNKVVLNAPDTLASLSVGNGEFAYTVDVTGLQTFYEDYENGVSLGTQSQWGWHRFPGEDKFTLEDVARYDTSCTGQVIPFPVQHKSGIKKQAMDELRTNPHRLHLGMIGLVLLKENGEKVNLADLTEINQVLDPWTGNITSEYHIEGQPVKVVLFGHQQMDAIGASITSPLIAAGRLKVFFKFPYGSDCHVCPGYDWNSPEKHQTTLANESDQSATLQRVLDTTQYFVQINWNATANLKEAAPQEWILAPGSSDNFSFTAHFKRANTQDALTFDNVASSSETGLDDYWKSGGFIDFGKATDPRAPELERRVILSQYLTKIQCSGSLPPQETGLTMNSWYGKFHLEMHWWHGVHFALWNKLPLLENSLGWYNDVIGNAKKTAEWQGFKGVRWQKMTDPYGNESPSSVGVYLVWQQPHPIYYAELVYRQKPTPETLAKYKDIVLQSAEFMADFAKKTGADDYYHLCPPVKPAQELFPANETWDPPFEMTYWHFALQIAQEWRKRLGLEVDAQWQDVIDNLAPLAIKDGLYLPSAGHPQSYEDDFYRHDHPVVVGSLGMLPYSERMDTAVMNATFDEIWNHWEWDTTWGWDYPMLAMTAARLNRPDMAINSLFRDALKNVYLPNGHNYQGTRLRIYLPGNGGLLTAVAMMAAGWDGSEGDAPGFPKDGTWNIRWEGLEKMP